MKSQNPQVKLPKTIAEFMDRGPDAIAVLENVINALLSMQARLATPTQAGGGTQLLLTESGAQLVLALRYPAGVPAAPPSYSAPTAAGSYSQAQLQAVMDQLAALTTTVAALREGENAVQSPAGQV